MNSQITTNDSGEASALASNNNETTIPDVLAETRLNPFERELFSGLGFSNEEIDQVSVARKPSEKSAKAKVNLPGLIADAKEELLNLAPKKALWSARAVGLALNRLGRYHKVNGFNAVGDALGKKGLGLPFLPRNPRLFQLACIGADSSAKEKAQEGLQELGLDVIKMLTVDPEVVGQSNEE